MIEQHDVERLAGDVEAAVAACLRLSAARSEHDLLVRLVPRLSLSQYAELYRALVAACPDEVRYDLDGKLDGAGDVQRTLTTLRSLAARRFWSPDLDALLDVHPLEVHVLYDIVKTEPSPDSNDMRRLCRAIARDGRVRSYHTFTADGACDICQIVSRMLVLRDRGLLTDDDIYYCYLRHAMSLKTRHVEQYPWLEDYLRFNSWLFEHGMRAARADPSASPEKYTAEVMRSGAP